MYRFIYLFCCVFGLGYACQGQTGYVDSVRADFDQLYGYDVLLNNGRKYFSEGNPAVGHPFWKSQELFVADLTFSGKTFKEQLLKYNLHKQEFILVYTNLNGQLNQIILNSSGIDSIRAGDCLFVPAIRPAMGQPFVQLIYSGKISCYIGWYKEFQFNTTGVNPGFSYGKDLRMYYLDYQGMLTKYDSKRSFLRNFQGKDRVTIRRYMSSKRFRFKKMNENNWRDLMAYCDKTLS